MDSTANGLNREWTQLRMDSTANGLNPGGTQPQKDSTLNGLNPERSKSRLGLLLLDSVLKGTQPKIPPILEWNISTPVVMCTAAATKLYSPCFLF
jgi:hypothetical protein